jgi:hypothetical protein
MSTDLRPDKSRYADHSNITTTKEGCWIGSSSLMPSFTSTPRNPKFAELPTTKRIGACPAKEMTNDDPKGIRQCRRVAPKHPIWCLWRGYRWWSSGIGFGRGW